MLENSKQKQAQPNCGSISADVPLPKQLYWCQADEAKGWEAAVHLTLWTFSLTLSSTTQMLANLHCCPLSWTLTRKAWLASSLPPFHPHPSAAARGFSLLALMSFSQILMELPLSFFLSPCVNYLIKRTKNLKENPSVLV